MSLGEYKRIRSTFKEEEANKALKAGWKLLSVAPGRDEQGWPIQMFTLGSTRSDEEAEAAKLAGQ